MSLVISLHGWGMRRDTYHHFIPLHQLAKIHNFILLEPKATTLGNWNWSYPEEKIPVLVSYAQNQWDVASERVFLVGHSAGAQAAYRVASKMDGIAGILSVSGMGPEPSSPTKLIHLHGKKDFNIWFSSGEKTVGRYKNVNECLGQTLVTSLVVGGAPSLKYSHQGCLADITFYAMDTGHYPELSIDFLFQVLNQLFGVVSH